MLLLGALLTGLTHGGQKSQRGARWMDGSLNLHATVNPHMQWVPHELFHSFLARSASQNFSRNDGMMVSTSSLKAIRWLSLCIGVEHHQRTTNQTLAEVNSNISLENQHQYSTSQNKRTMIIQKN